MTCGASATSVCYLMLDGPIPESREDRMVIGTWNMEGRGGAAQSDFLLGGQCDVWLLTEVPVQWTLPGFYLTRCDQLMGPRKHWAAVASKKPAAKLPDPHPASVAAAADGVTYVSSILPWRGSGGGLPWHGTTHAERMGNTLAALEPFLVEQAELVWGGDWNQSMACKESVGSLSGRRALASLLSRLGLDVPTAHLPHRNDALRTIDHLAWRGARGNATRVVAALDGRRLSDHDAYVTET